MRFFYFFSLRVIIEIILEVFTKKNRAFLIKIFKYLGWTLLLLGIIAIFIGYTTSEPQSGFSGLGNVILFLGGIICCLVGFSLITGWFSVWQSRSLYDYDYEHSWSEIIGSVVNEDPNQYQDSEYRLEQTIENPSEVNNPTKDNSALPWLIGSVSTLAFILVASVIFLWLRSVADEILIGGPPPTLTGWEQSYQELTGFDEVSGLDGSGVVVCVVDSGIEMDHPDLTHLTLAGWFDVINGQNEPYDDEGHGTAMAGIIVAKNGLTGNAQGVDLLVAKAIDSNGQGTDTGIAEAVDWCADNQADIISLSLGGEGGISIGGITTDQLENAVQDALEQGIFVVAAAGNDGGQDDDGDVSSPGSVEDVICVGGVTRLGNVWSGSSEGDNDGRLWPPMLPRSDPDMKPEILGPGAEVPILFAGGSGDGSWWGWASGTSAATAWVSGGLAIILEAHPELQREGASGGPNAIELIKTKLSDNSQMDDGQSEHDDRFGYGIFRIDFMLDSLSNSSSEEETEYSVMKLQHSDINSGSNQAERRKTPIVPPASSTKAAEWFELTD
ncbi:MAG: S8 family serine peptidase [Candidatus Thermoplasmatota archaeon]|nr:S8 family serine peptidase [Candidatus Thermoplasmatota archaeon]